MGKEITELSGGFEGPEKKLEIDFRQTSCPVGLRVISQPKWQKLLTLVKCTILSRTRNEHFDAYVLSESSLFVYPYKVILKTCGTTTLLRCVPKLLEMAEELGFAHEFVFFSRKNFNFPEHQAYPHSGFDVEVDFLNSIFPNGNAYEFGSPNSNDKWFLYIADNTNNTSKEANQDQTFEVIMCDLDPEAMKPFFKTTDFTSAKSVTVKTGIAELIPGSVTDEFMFDPCGYSVNGLRGDVYFTIHVTPEPEFSFVSFDSNVPLVCYKELLNKVLDIFRPGRCVVLLFADAYSMANKKKHSFHEDVPGYIGCDQFYRDFSEYYLTVATLRRNYSYGNGVVH